MKKIFIFITVMVCMVTAAFSAENTEVTKRLRNKFSLVQYHPEGGGWYFIKYSTAGQAFYGMCDNKGNVVAQDATEYKIHKGYIEMYLLDMEQKQAHDNWIRQMDQYRADLAKYESIKADYNAQMEAYNAQVKAAEQQAQDLYNARRQEAYDNAVAYEKQRQAIQNSGNQNTSILGAILTGVLDGVSLAAVGNAAANKVQYDPIYRMVLAQNRLTTPPAKPYNPKPTAPSEPSNGHMWRNFTFIQPTPYSGIDYAAISGSEGYADVQQDGLWGLVDASLSEVYPCSNKQKVKQGSLHNLTKVCVDGLYGLLGARKKEVLRPIYTDISATTHYVMACKNGLWGLYRTNGEALTPHKFANIQLTKDGFMGKVENSWGLYTETGRQILPPEYAQIILKNNFVYCLRDGKWGLYKSNGEQILSTSYDQIEPREDGYIYCSKNGLWGVFTNDAKELYPCQFQSAETISMKDGKLTLYIKTKGAWGLLDFHTGDEILPCYYSNISLLTLDQDQYISVTKGGKKGLYDLDGLLLLPCEFTEIKLQQEPNLGRKMFITKSDDKVGLFNRLGVPMFPNNRYTQYEYKAPFFYVQNGKLKGLVTEFGEELIPCKYNEITYYKDAHCFVVRADNRSGLLDLQGKPVFDELDYQINLVHSNYISIYDRNTRRYGAINYSGKIIVPCRLKSSMKVGGMVEKYQRKVDLNGENSAGLAQLASARSNFTDQTKQELRHRTSFSFYAQNYVGRIIQDWQTQGDYETPEDYVLRVNNETRAQKVYELTKNAQDAYLEYFEARLPKDEVSIVGKYDPNHQSFRISSKNAKKDILVPVDKNDAPEFFNMFNSLRKEATYCIENDQPALKEYTFYMPNGNHQYKYSNNEAVEYSVAKVDYHFDDIEISTASLGIGTSDVDINIPVTQKDNSNVHVLIIANEHYIDAPNVSYAYNDGNTFREYCIKALGIPKENILFKPDATYNQMRQGINQMRDRASNELIGKDARLLIYYSGHGIPDERGMNSYLLPVDGSPRDIVNTGYRVSDLYDMLGQLACESTVLMDACFSGVTRAGESLAQTRGVAFRAAAVPQGRTVAISACKDNEVALPYDKQYHGLFTYELLKHIKDAKGEVSLGNLFNFVQKEVNRISLLELEKGQTPTVASGKEATNWAKRIF